MDLLIFLVPIIYTIILLVAVSYSISYILFIYTSLLSGNGFKNTFKVSFIAPFIDNTTRTFFILIILLLLLLSMLGLVSVYI